MILLAHDCLFFELPNGDRVPLRSEMISIEVSSDAPTSLDAEVVAHATAAVFHYFKHDLERLTVTVDEFSAALERVLRRLAEIWGGTPKPPPDEWWSDLDRLAAEADGSELAFFTRLRAELRGGLSGQPAVLRFHGLRGCVKALAGARRWTGRCRELRDAIVDYLRRCLAAEAGRRPCSLVVD
jgi:hypothetical protein